MRRLPVRVRLCGLLALTGVPTSVISAQQQAPRARITGSLETGAAAVEQPLVRSGAAYYIAPTAQLSSHDLTIGGDAVFAMGTPIWKSFLGNGFIRSPEFHNVRLTGSAQLLKTSGLVPTLHGDIGAEWRASSLTNTAMVRVRSGEMRYAGGWWRDMDVGASATHLFGPTVLVLDAMYSDARRPMALQEQLGVNAGTGAAFGARTLDLTPRMIWERSRLRADASVALRAVESGISGTRIGPQLSFTFTTSRGVSLFLGGTQRLPDVRSGLPSGRSALLGVRIEGRRLLSRPATAVGSRPVLRVENGALIVDVGTVAASYASLRGDFTEWKPRTCHARGERVFDCGQAPPAGTWRVAIRLNDGSWQQPGNLAAAADDFGQVDGVLMTGGKP